MDTLTFISNVINSLVWPVVLLSLFLIFKKPLIRLSRSLKFLRYSGLEAEMVSPQEAGEQEINTIAAYLQRGPHSFQWFRDNTEFDYTNDEFNTLISTHSGIFESINIVSSDVNKRKTSPGLPGMRLTHVYRERIASAIMTTK